MIVTGGILGRHLMCTTVLPPGTTVLPPERPTISALHRERRSRRNRCEHCMSMITTSGEADAVAVRCRRDRSCSAVYCSCECREAADLKWHWHECGQRYASELGGEHLLAFRWFLLVARPEGGGKQRLDLLSSLQTNVELLSDDVRRRVRIAAACLARIDFNGAINGLVLGPQEREDLHYRHLLQIQANCHACTETTAAEDCRSSSVSSLSQQRVGVALYATASLINHSCTPNALCVYDAGGATIRIVSTRAIRPGEQIAISYGPTRANEPSAEVRRAALMSQYQFLCNCVDCSKEEKRSKTLGFIENHYQVLCTCDAAAGTTPPCGQPRRKRPEKNTMTPAAVRTRCQQQDELAREAASNHDFARAATHCAEAVSLLERHVYGRDSVELARERFKLAHLLFNGGDFRASARALALAEPILSMLPATDPTVLDCREVAAALRQLGLLPGP